MTVSWTVLGSSGGAPTRTNPASGYLLETGQTTIWVDAGTGTFMPLAARVDPGYLDAVVISHIHVDHCSDLYGLYGYLAYGPSGIVPVPVYVPDGAAEHLAGFARAAEEHVFHQVLDLRTVAPGDEATVGEVRIVFGEAIHPVPALVTRFEAGGTSVVYSGDTGPGGDLARLATGADLLVCEASMQGVRGPETYPYHLTAGETGALAAAAGVGELLVTHVAAVLDPAVGLGEAEAAFGRPARLAVPGETVTIGRSDR